MPRRNWEAICQLSDYRTRVAISLADDPEILACFVRGFPNLFVEDEEDAGPLRVPLSVLMAKAEEVSREDNPYDPCAWEEDRHFNLGQTAQELGIPIAFSAWDDEGETVPVELLESLVGQKAQAGMVATYLGKGYIVLNLWLRSEHWWSKSGASKLKVGSVITEPPLFDHISLADVGFVDLDK